MAEVSQICDWIDLQLAQIVGSNTKSYSLGGAILNSDYQRFTPTRHHIAGGPVILLVVYVVWSCSLYGHSGQILYIFLLLTKLVQVPCPSSQEFALILIATDSVPSMNRTLVCNVLHTAKNHHHQELEIT